MLNRTPVAPEARPPVPDFDPVPVRFRYDGWTPARQKAFIAALAETGMTSRAAAAVNMSVEGAYALRRHPGAEGFRRAWDAALDFGVLRLRDLAMERAIVGEIIPVFQKGKLLGYRRKHNDRLLIFCLRHYGVDRGGKRTTINYFSSRAEAGAGGQGEGTGAARASATTVRTVITGCGEQSARDPAESAHLLDGFEGVELDEAARAEIDAALLACAERQRALAEAADNGPGGERIEARLADPAASFVRTGENDLWHGDFLASQPEPEQGDFIEGESSWHLAGAPIPEMYLPYATPENSTLTAEQAERRAIPLDAVAEAQPRKRYKRKSPSPG